MQLEDYFDFHSEGDIRLAGTRVGIETVLLAYLDDKQSAEEIAALYPGVTLEQVYGAILHYLHYRKKMDGYLDTYIEGSHHRQEMQDRGPSPLIRRLSEASLPRSSVAAWCAPCSTKTFRAAPYGNPVV